MANDKTLQQNNLSHTLSSTADHIRCGYPVYNDNQDIRWKCIYCSLIIKEPIQLTQCGHRSCKGCFESRAAVTPNDVKMQCPVSDCQEIFDKTDVRIIFMHIEFYKDNICIFYFKGDA
jgi:hypothetical protein